MTDPYRTAAPPDKIDYDYYAKASPDKIRKIHDSLDLFDWKVCFTCEGVNNKEEKYFKTFECSKEPKTKYYIHPDRPGYDDGEFLFKKYMHFAMEKKYLFINDVLIPINRFIKAEVVEKVCHHLEFDWYRDLQ